MTGIIETVVRYRIPVGDRWTISIERVGEEIFVSLHYADKDTATHQSIYSVKEFQILKSILE